MILQTITCDMVIVSRTDQTFDTLEAIPVCLSECFVPQPSKAQRTPVLAVSR